MNKFSKLLNKINSTESYTMDMVLKFLPDPTHELVKKNQSNTDPNFSIYGINFSI